MPRHVRNLSKSKIYHVMVRGNEKKNIFLDDADKQRYFETLSRLAGHYSNGIKQKEPSLIHAINDKKIFVYAYCLMDNHVHLLINEGEDEISRVMKRLGTSYAYYFNKKYGRVGHLFQDRFRSEVVENDGYFLTVVRYIHNNPVKAGVTTCASHYNWSSYKEYTNGKQSFIDKDKVLDLFSTDKGKAIKSFIEFSNEKNSDILSEPIEKEDKKTIVKLQDASEFIRDFLAQKSLEPSQLIKRSNIVIRNELIHYIRANSNLSIVQIAELLNVNRGIVERAKCVREPSLNTFESSKIL